MTFSAYVGRWALISSASINSEISFIGEDPDPNGVNDWLNGDAIDLVDGSDPTTGLLLQIEQDGSFSEQKTGNPKVYWFDSEGVLTNDVEPFDGRLQSNESNVFLRPSEIPSWAIPVEGKHGRAILRLDDGDTKISDRLDVIGDRLIRSVNVVTDELYLDRIVIVYSRS